MSNQPVVRVVAPGIRVSDMTPDARDAIDALDLDANRDGVIDATDLPRLESLDVDSVEDPRRQAAVRGVRSVALKAAVLAPAPGSAGRPPRVMTTDVASVLRTVGDSSALAATSIAERAEMVRTLAADRRLGWIREPDALVTILLTGTPRQQREVMRALDSLRLGRSDPTVQGSAPKPMPPFVDDLLLAMRQTHVSRVAALVASARSGSDHTVEGRYGRLMRLTDDNAISHVRLRRSEIPFAPAGQSSVAQAAFVANPILGHEVANIIRATPDAERAALLDALSRTPERLERLLAAARSAGFEEEMKALVRTTREVTAATELRVLVAVREVFARNVMAIVRDADEATLDALVRDTTLLASVSSHASPADATSVRSALAMTITPSTQTSVAVAALAAIGNPSATALEPVLARPDGLQGLNAQARIFRQFSVEAENAVRDAALRAADAEVGLQTLAIMSATPRTSRSSFALQVMGLVERLPNARAWFASSDYRVIARSADPRTRAFLRTKAACTLTDSEELARALEALSGTRVDNLPADIEAIRACVGGSILARPSGF